MRRAWQYHHPQGPKAARNCEKLGETGNIVCFRHYARNGLIVCCGSFERSKTNHTGSMAVSALKPLYNGYPQDKWHNFFRNVTLRCPATRPAGSASTHRNCGVGFARASRQCPLGQVRRSERFMLSVAAETHICGAFSARRGPARSPSSAASRTSAPCR